MALAAPSVIGGAGSARWAREAADAARIADAAGRELVALRQLLSDCHADVSRARSMADRGSHELITRMLFDSYPDDPILSEEGLDDERRLQSDRVWIVDPLDGTREFGEPPRSDWAVHVALVSEGQPVAGAVAMPARGLTVSSDYIPGFRRHDDRPLRIVVSRTRPPEIVDAVAAELGAEIVPMGSAGAKTMAVLVHEADVYLHAGGQYEWDSAAPVAVAQAAGLHVSRLSGAALRYNSANPWLPDLLICRVDIAPIILRIIAQGRR